MSPFLTGWLSSTSTSRTMECASRTAGFSEKKAWWPGNAGRKISRNHQKCSIFRRIHRKLEKLCKIGLVRRGRIPRVAPPTARAAAVSIRSSLKNWDLSGAAPEKSSCEIILVGAPVCPFYTGKPEPRRKSCRQSISSFARDATLRPKRRSHPHL